MENQKPVTPAIIPQIVVEQSKQNNFLVILLSILLFISVSISGFFAFQTQRLNEELIIKNEELKQTTQNFVESTVEPVATESSEADPTANWKMYTNNEYKFSFKYPVNLTQDENGLVGGTFLGSPKIAVTFVDNTTVKDGTDAPFDGFTIYQLPDTENSLENFIKKEVIAIRNSPRGILNEEIKTILVAGKTSYYIDAEQNIRQYFVPSVNNSVILFSTVRQTDSFILILNQILSTFKFTN